MEFISYIWIIIMIIASIIEAATAQIVSVWIAIASLFALFSSFVTDNINIQVAIFLFVLVLTLVLFMPISRKKLKVNLTKTNADKYIGKEGIVLEEIDNISGSGQVKVCGNIWSARSFDSSIISKDSTVVVNDISGVKLIVSKFEK